jgi:hypothetical protein
MRQPGHKMRKLLQQKNKQWKSFIKIFLVHPFCCGFVINNQKATKSLPLCHSMVGCFWRHPEPVFVDLLRGPGIDSQHGGPVRQPYLSYQPARPHRLAVSVYRNRFLASKNVYKYGPWMYALLMIPTPSHPSQHMSHH